MNKELKQKWIATLRSGEYEQGSGVLRSEDNKFCCLGVLCNLIDPSGWGELKKNQFTGSYGYIFDEVIDDSYGLEYLPKTLADKIELPKDIQDGLADMNDMGKNFEYIADIIEADFDFDLHREIEEFEDDKEF